MLLPYNCTHVRIHAKVKSPHTSAARTLRSCKYGKHRLKKVGAEGAVSGGDGAIRQFEQWAAIRQVAQEGVSTGCCPVHWETRWEERRWKPRLGWCFCRGVFCLFFEELMGVRRRGESRARNDMRAFVSCRCFFFFFSFRLIAKYLHYTNVKKNVKLWQPLGPTVHVGVNFDIWFLV